MEERNLINVQEKTKAQNLRVAIDFNTIKTEFATNVQIETGPDCVNLNFIQLYQGAPDDQPNAKIISRIALTWPHFSKLAKILNELQSTHKELAYNEFINSVMKNEEE